MRASLVSLLALVSLGCGEPPPTPGQTNRAIIGGTVDTGHPAVVALAGGTGRPFCSGTIIDATHVLTAGHCVASDGAGPARPPAYVVICHDTRSISPFTNPECYLRTRSAKVHPGFRLIDSPHLDAVNDVAVVELAAPTTIAPIPLPKAPLPAEAVGSGIRKVGYGLDENRRSGVKRQVVTEVTFVGPMAAGSTAPNPDGLFEGMYQMANDRGSCNGDSGGPALWPVDGSAEEQVVGVTSTGDRACRTWGVDTDVGTFLCWLRDAGVAGAGCATAP
jgi:secreted trypsin-like serine protease